MRRCLEVLPSAELLLDIRSGTRSEFQSCASNKGW